MIEFLKNYSTTKKIFIHEMVKPKKSNKLLSKNHIENGKYEEKSHRIGKRQVKRQRPK